MDEDLIIEVMQGNTKDISFTVEINNEPFIPEEGDYIYFTVKNMKFNPDYALIKKSYPKDIDFNADDNSFTIHLLPQDTNNLCSGDYNFDLNFVFKGIEGDKIKTPVEGFIRIKSATTRKEDRV